jgi:hypothetical protein
MLVRRSLAALEERIYQLLMCREHLLALIHHTGRVAQPRSEQQPGGAARRRTVR